ncbi:MAG: TrmO family methyltransferase, partial [Cyanobacteria bacterium P01_H01_bin.121]
VVFWLHGQNYGNFKPLVQPPILGGKKTIGVYATRSPNRPNPVGLSVVRLESMTFRADELCLTVSGGDFLDATPVIDIKPYLPYVDAIATANNAWAEPQAPLSVQWREAAVNALWQSNCPEPEQMQQLITETLAQDPRPAHERGKDGHPGQQWNFHVNNLSVFWIVEG